jgi:serine/threonine protein kinase
MAPEIIQGKGYSFNSDLWSLGVILYEMIFACLPFAEVKIGENINIRIVKILMRFMRR